MNSTPTLTSSSWCVPTIANDTKHATRLAWAETALAAATFVVALLAVASHFTNFTQPLPPPGALITPAATGLSQATIFFIAGAGVGLVGTVMLEILRRRAINKGKELADEDARRSQGDVKGSGGDDVQGRGGDDFKQPPSPAPASPAPASAAPTAAASSAQAVELSRKFPIDLITNLPGLEKALHGTPLSSLVVDENGNNALHLLARTELRPQPSGVVAAEASPAVAAAPASPDKSLKVVESAKQKLANDIVALLLEKANNRQNVLTAKNKDGETPLMVAQKSNNNEVAIALQAAIKLNSL